MFKIALNAGHGINTSGKRCLKSIDTNDLNAWVDCMLEISIPARFRGE